MNTIDPDLFLATRTDASTEPTASADATSSVPVHPIDALRRAPHLTARTLPPVPTVAYVEPATLCREVEWVAARHVAPLAQAAEELRENHALLRSRCGERAPRPEHLAALALRVRELDDALARLDALAAVAKQQLTLALSDLSRTVREVAHRIDFEEAYSPGFSESFPRVREYTTRRGAEVSDGVRRAKRLREAVEKARADVKGDPPSRG